jgi:1-acyl-sn-glycerol-3-phosphate acyltransferase
MTRRPAESLLARWGRRAVSFSVWGVAWLLGLLSLAALPLVALVDLLRGSRLAWTRGQAALVYLLTCEVFGLLAAGALWLVLPLVSRERWLALNRRLQQLWVRALMLGLRLAYGLRLVVEGEEALDHEGPLVVLTRHVSTLDTLLPAHLLAGRRLRYVLKRELLWDPCLDVVGQRLPNVFVRRGSGDTARELDKLRALATDLGPGDAATIFPEGTRFTPARRERILAGLARRGDELALARAKELVHVLPPRSAGTQALLASCPEASVILLGHAGLEGARTLASLASGALVGREVRVRLQRVPAAEIPRDPDALEAWLWEAWQAVDDWLEEVAGCPQAAETT